MGHTDNFMYDTYTTRLELDVDSSCVSTLYDENEVMLQLWLEGKGDRGGADYRNRSFPLGTKVVVKRSDGTVADERYFNEQGTDGTAEGFVLVNLGTAWIEPIPSSCRSRGTSRADPWIPCSIGAKPRHPTNTG